MRLPLTKKRKRGVVEICLLDGGNCTTAWDVVGGNTYDCKSGVSESRCRSNQYYRDNKLYNWWVGTNNGVSGVCCR